MTQSNFITIQGAREHNLKNINLQLPRNKLIVITGLSGAGKSSLAFDIIYAEGQRRYVESLSVYARQFLEVMQKPDVDLIEGLSPAISIEQKTTSRNPRSTVGTVTEVYDYLRLLFARVGVPYSPATGLPIRAQTISQIVDKICAMPEGTKLMILAPVVRGRKGEYKKLLQDLQQKGFQRVAINGELYNLDEVPTLTKNQKHSIEVVIDRIVVKPEIKMRVTESVETAVRLSEGIVLAQEADTKKVTTFSTKFSCPESGFTIAEIEPRLFSFNNPFGACPECSGLGVISKFEPALIIPDPKLTLAQGAVAPWSNGVFKSYYLQFLAGLAHHFNSSIHIPFAELNSELQQTILHGSGQTPVPIVLEDASRRFTINKPFEGVIPNLKKRLNNSREEESNSGRDDLRRYLRDHPCSSCNGQRLKPEALCIKINERTISEVADLSIDQALKWIEALQFSTQEQQIAERILKEINSRLSFLVSVGLGYLTLSRMAGTLSGGESQRIRLASQIGSGLTGVIYVLDEPSIGLHQCDNDRLLTMLKRLRDLGNTVIVVEHDEDAIRCADYVVDMGPYAGVHGGEIIVAGTPAEVMAHPHSLTGKYLKGELKVGLPQQRRAAERCLEITGVTTNNLKQVNCRIPLGSLVCVTGVSGSGKSSLIMDTLCPALTAALERQQLPLATYKNLSGIEYIDKLINIDQSPIGRTPRSNPATYTGIFTMIRDWFASLPEAQARGYTAGRFSFNVKGGRCEACEGDGVIKVEMHFLPDVYVTCDQCQGHRYNRETLEVKFKGKSIADVLDMTIESGLEFFENMAAIRSKLMVLYEVGLGYLQIGQRATTLSGGEAQRVKLAKELSRRGTGNTLYVLDEPTTGLHFHDVNKLLEVLQRLVSKGNSMIIIEHNLDVIKAADWIIDLGPGGGSDGGRIVASGTPEQVAANPNSATAKYL